MQKKRILILDDEEALRTILASELREEGYKVLAMDPKTDGYDLLTQWKPDMILSDIMSPGMDGWQFLHWVRANPLASKVSFIFVTGNSSLENAIRSKRIGANDFVSKPYDLLGLLEVIKREFAKQHGPAWDVRSPLVEGDSQEEIHHRPWRYLSRRWKSALRSSPYRTAVLGTAAWKLDFVVDDGGSLTVGRFFRPLDRNARYSPKCFHPVIDGYGAETGIIYILGQEEDQGDSTSRVVIASGEETTDVFRSGIFAPNLNRFEK